MRIEKKSILMDRWTFHSCIIAIIEKNNKQPYTHMWARIKKKWKILPVSCVYYCSSSTTRHVQFDDDDDDESLCFTSFAFCLLFRSYLLCFLYTSAKCCKMLILQFYSTHELLSSPLINIILKVKPLLQLLVLIHTSMRFINVWN